MADQDSPSNHMSSTGDLQQPLSNHQEQQQESTTNDWPW